jgi:hypothetical protein
MTVHVVFECSCCLESVPQRSEVRTHVSEPLARNSCAVWFDVCRPEKMYLMPVAAASCCLFAWPVRLVIAVHVKERVDFTFT